MRYGQKIWPVPRLRERPPGLDSHRAGPAPVDIHSMRRQVQTLLSQRTNSIQPGLRRIGYALLGVGIPRIPKPSIA